ncbi:hypothetical protein MRB53_038056 [Persea americana]|nr:hypothetical protein MRB53_038056 [Persea americana]
MHGWSIKVRRTVAPYGLQEVALGVLIACFEISAMSHQPRDAQSAVGGSTQASRASSDQRRYIHQLAYNDVHASLGPVTSHAHGTGPRLWPSAADLRALLPSLRHTIASKAVRPELRCTSGHHSTRVAPAVHLDDRDEGFTPNGATTAWLPSRSCNVTTPLRPPGIVTRQWATGRNTALMAPPVREDEYASARG